MYFCRVLPTTTHVEETGTVTESAPDTSSPRPQSAEVPSGGRTS